LHLVSTLVSSLVARTLPGWYDLRQYQAVSQVQSRALPEEGPPTRWEPSLLLVIPLTEGLTGHKA